MKKKTYDFASIKRLCIGLSLCCMVTGAQAVPASSAFNQRFDVALSFNNATLKNVVQSLKKQTDILFSYDTSLESFKVNNVSVKAEKESIEAILNQVFKGTDIRYKIEDGIVMLYSPATASGRGVQATQQKTKRISGIVKDATGEPIIGANVIVKGTTNGVITGLDGDFTLEVSTIANVVKLMGRPISSAEEMLQGQIPGVTVTSNGGHPDATPSITIRGMGSRNGETPLYVVDGVPGAPFNFSDVVSMTVLKDAASAAIYGAYAGSAGVILVTTKQAAPGHTTVTYDMVTGFSQASNLPQSLTIEEEKMVRAKALGFDSVDELAANIAGWNVQKNPYIGQTRTDWMDAIFRTAPFQRHNVAISGGTEEFSNRASIEYSNRQGTLINTYNKSITARLNSMWKINPWIQVREDLS